MGATYYAVTALRALNVRDPESHRCIQWIKSLASGTGGFADDTAASADADVDSTFYAVRSLVLLGDRLSPRLRSGVARFLRACQNADGGFGMVPGGRSDMNNTYCAIHPLSLLGLDIPRRNRCVRWTRSCRRQAGGFSWRPGQRYPRLDSTYWAIQSLTLLGVARRTSRGLTEWILECQRPNGAFTYSAYSVKPAQLWPTYCAASALAALSVAVSL